jgi:hypothetical protein
MFTTLAQNSDATMQALGQQLLNDQHRYLLQKFFDNERSFVTSTVGGSSTTLTGAVSAGATSATLTSVWAYPTNSQLVNFSDGEQRNVLFTFGSASISWQVALTGNVTSAISTVGYQYYSIPAQISKITDNTITIGQLKYTIIPIQTRVEWDKVNTLPYSSDIPQYAFIYNGTLGIFPIPSTTGNTLSFNYKARVSDFSNNFLFSDIVGTAFIAGETAYDYQKGTVLGSNNSTTVTGTSTAWATAFPTGKDITQYNLYLSANPSKGDGLWYPISTFDSATSLTLALPLVDAIDSTSTYSIGQMPVLFEDFADTIVYGALMIYFSSIVKDPERAKLFERMYRERLVLMSEYLGSKQVMVDLGGTPNPINTNLYLYANS